MTRQNSPVRPATFIPLPEVATVLGFRSLVLASETFQHTGSFKFRAAWNVASQVENRMIIAASSGNFGQALAYACRLLGKRALIIMPTTSVAAKIAAVKRHGGDVDFIDTAHISRAERLAELAASYPSAYIASPYDDDLVIRGNASLGIEIAVAEYPISLVIAPVGGGGLISGIASGFISVESDKMIFGAEPSLADDAARSLEAGRLIANEQEPQTIADGARTLSLGRRNWEIIRQNVTQIYRVSERSIRDAVRLLFEWNLLVEPTGALAVAAAVSYKRNFRDLDVCCVVSGGNADPQVYANIIREVT